jgi:hypothetical protein
MYYVNAIGMPPLPQARTFRLHDTHPILQKYVSALQNLQFKKKSVLRIRDVYPGSEFFPSRIPDTGLKYSASWIRISNKEF